MGTSLLVSGRSRTGRMAYGGQLPRSPDAGWGTQRPSPTRTARRVRAVPARYANPQFPVDLGAFTSSRFSP